MQMANLKTPLNHLHNSNNKSSNFFNSTISTNAASAARLRLRCSSQLSADHLQIERRSGNYSPSRWDADFIQSLQSDYKVNDHIITSTDYIYLYYKFLISSDLYM